MYKVRILALLYAILFFLPSLVTAQNIITIAGGLGAGPAINLGMISNFVTRDTSGNMYIVDGNYAVIRKVNSSGMSVVVAGNGTAGFSGDGGAATTAQIRPAGIVVDPSGNIYIADGGNNRIRKINTSGVITTIAGTGASGFSGDGGPATAAQFKNPYAIALDASGNIYVTDQQNYRIRKINTAGIVTTVAGTGVSGYNGDNIAANTAQLNTPFGITVDATGNLYIADGTNCRVRKVSTAGIITTVAGNGIMGYSGDGGAAIAAKLANPYSIAFDGYGRMIIADRTNNRLRMVDTAGYISTIAGNGNYAFSGDGGPALAAEIYYPTSVVTDNAGNIYMADYNNRIRKIDTSGIINSVAGNGSPGYSGDGGSAIAAQISYDILNRPIGDVKLDAAGNIYIADAQNHRVRKINTAGVITTFAGNGSKGLAGDGGLATAAQLNMPDGITFDAAGNVYISDLQTGNIRKVSPNGVISKYAGMGLPYYNGDGGQATNTAFSPMGMVMDASGNMYVADPGNQRVRKISSTGIVTTIAGNGTFTYSGDGGLATAAAFSNPTDVAFDASGNLYIADEKNNRIRKVDAAGIVTTVAGNGGYGFGGDGGLAIAATLKYPRSIAFDTVGNLYILDVGNDRVRKVDTMGIITTVAGTGGYNYTGDGGPATAASLSELFGLTVDRPGNIYIGDGYRVRKVGIPVAPSISVAAVQNNICAGSYMAFTASPLNGGVSPSYQWKVNGVNVGNDTSFYTYMAVNGDVVSCVLTSSDPNATPTTAISNNVTVSVQPLVSPSINIVASSNSICTGDSVTFTAASSNGGTTPVYQWSVNGVSAGTNATTYKYAPINGDIVKCTITSSAMCLSNPIGASNNIMIVVNAYVVPTATLSVSPSPICAGVPVNFTGASNLGVNGSYNFEYYYKSNLSNYYSLYFSGNGGGSVFTYTPQNGDSIFYKISAVGGCVSATTATSQVLGITLTPVTNTAVQVSSSSNNVCSGTQITYVATPTNGGPSPSYQWSVNGVVVGSNSGSYNYAPANGDVVTCSLASSVSCPMPAVAVSNSTTMNITSSVTPAITLTASDSTVCAGAPVVYIAAPMNGGTTPVLQWRVNGINVGTNSSIYSYNPSNNDVVNCELTSNATCITTPTVVSNNISTTVIPVVAPLVTIAPSQNGICAGTPINFMATAVNGGAAPIYQWVVNGVAASVNSPSYSYIPANGDIVKCTLFSTATCAIPNAVNSNSITANVNAGIQPVVNIIANPATGVAMGQQVIFTANVASGGINPQYQWRKNNTDIAGATQSSYIAIAGVDVLNNDVISLRLKNTDSCGLSATSNNWTVSIATGIGQVANNSDLLRLYPNPNDGTFIVSGSLIPYGKHTVLLDVWNVIGQSVYRKMVDVANGNLEYKMEMAQLTPGNYFLRIDGGKMGILPFTVSGR